MNVQEFYDYCKKLHAEDYKLIEITYYPVDGPIASTTKEKYLTIQNSNQIWNETPPEYYGYEENIEYDDFLKLECMTMKEFYNWAKIRNYLNFQVECDNSQSRKQGHNYLVEDCICINHEEKTVNLIRDMYD